MRRGCGFSLILYVTAALGPFLLVALSGALTGALLGASSGALFLVINHINKKPNIARSWQDNSFSIEINCAATAAI